MKRNNFKEYLVFIGILISMKSFAQSDMAAPGTGHAGLGFPSYYLGWDVNTNFALEIRHDNPAESIDFYIGPTQYLGITTLGDLDITQGGNGYQIAGQYVLRHNNITSNILVGVGAGANTTGAGNSFLGAFSGNTNTSGSRNTILGFYSGGLNDLGNDNTFTGNYCGFSNFDGNNNTFNGSNSGYSNTAGSENSFYGYHSGGSNLDGSRNTFQGAFAGFTSQDISDLTMIGYEAGFLNTMTNNTMIGF